MVEGQVADRHARVRSQEAAFEAAHHVPSILALQGERRDHTLAVVGKPGAAPQCAAASQRQECQCLAQARQVLELVHPDPLVPHDRQLAEPSHGLQAGGLAAFSGVAAGATQQTATQRTHRGGVPCQERAFPKHPSSSFYEIPRSLPAPNSYADRRP